jgi:hypothetical protein
VEQPDRVERDAELRATPRVLEHAAQLGRDLVAPGGFGALARGIEPRAQVVGCRRDRSGDRGTQDDRRARERYSTDGL